MLIVFIDHLYIGFQNCLNFKTTLIHLVCLLLSLLKLFRVVDVNVAHLSMCMPLFKLADAVQSVSKTAPQELTHLSWCVRFSGIAKNTE